jgi:hypothetical protein
MHEYSTGKEHVSCTANQQATSPGVWGSRQAIPRSESVPGTLLNKSRPHTPPIRYRYHEEMCRPSWVYSTIHSTLKYGKQINPVLGGHFCSAC